MRIGIIGLGMVGSAIRHGFTRLGHTVVGYDIKDPTTLAPNLMDTEVLFVCVPTPCNFDGSCDTSIVAEVVKDLHLSGYRGLCTIKSTVTPGTTDRLTQDYPNLRLAFCPEFLREKAAYTDFNENHDVCVIGAYQEVDAEILKRAHGHLPQNFALMRPLEAEFTKYFSNVFNAVRIIFANQFYDVCKAAGADYQTIKNAMVKRSTIADAYLDCNENFRGFGGACLPKDAAAFAAYTKKLGLAETMFSDIVSRNKNYKTTLL